MSKFKTILCPIDLGKYPRATPCSKVKLSTHSTLKAATEAEKNGEKNAVAIYHATRQITKATTSLCFFPVHGNKVARKLLATIATNEDLIGVLRSAYYR